jgi:hypothetical protein
VDPIDQTLSTADHAWRAYGVRAADRAALAADLRLDLESAAADGVGPAQLLGADVPEFARRLADEAGVHREPPELGLLLGTALVGATLGASVGFAALTLAAPFAVDFVDPPTGARIPVQVAVTVYYGIPAAIVLAGALVAVRYRLREVARIRATTRAMALLLPLAGLLVTPIVMAFAAMTDFSTSAPVVVTEVLIIAAALAGATVLARRWALREPAEPTRAAAA